MINNINIKKTDHANTQAALCGKIALQNFEEWEKLKLAANIDVKSPVI